MVVEAAVCREKWSRQDEQQFEEHRDSEQAAGMTRREKSGSGTGRRKEGTLQGAPRQYCQVPGEPVDEAKTYSLYLAV